MSEDADRPETNGEQPRGDDRPAPERPAVGPPPTPAAQPPVDRAIARLGRGLGGRSLSVYGILLAGAAVLLILLAIVWLTADDGGDGGGPTCPNIFVDEANELIDSGEVERIEVAYSQDHLEIGGVILSLRMLDGACRALQPQGIEGRDAIWQIVGHAWMRNDITEERQIEIETDNNDTIPPALLWTPTPPPTETVEPTLTVPVPTEPPASPTPVPPTDTPPASPAPDASPQASPDVPPDAASPAPLETATATTAPPA